MVEYATNLATKTGLNSENAIKMIQSINETLDQIIEEGRVRSRENLRKMEDERLKRGLQEEREARAVGEQNVQGQTAEYLMPKNVTPTSGTEGIYTTQAPTYGEEDKVVHGGAYSNIGVLPGRTYGDFRKEREFEKQRELETIKAGAKETGYDKILQETVKGKSDQIETLQKNVHFMNPEDKAKAQATITGLNEEIKALNAESLRRSTSKLGTAATTERPGYSSYIQGVKQVTEPGTKKVVDPIVDIRRALETRGNDSTFVAALRNSLGKATGIMTPQQIDEATKIIAEYENRNKPKVEQPAAIPERKFPGGPAQALTTFRKTEQEKEHEAEGIRQTAKLRASSPTTSLSIQHELNNMISRNGFINTPDFIDVLGKYGIERGSNEFQTLSKSYQQYIRGDIGPMRFGKQTSGGLLQ